MNNLTDTFNGAAAGPSGEGEAVTCGPNPVGPTSPAAAFAEDAQAPAESSSTSPTTVFSAVQMAQAELKALEAGRAKPAPRLNCNPPDRDKTPVDRTIERNREARASALDAYIQFEQSRPIHEIDQEQSEGLEFNW